MNRIFESVISAIFIMTSSEIAWHQIAGKGFGNGGDQDEHVERCQRDDKSAGVNPHGSRLLVDAT
jgi:hypothetical protein